MINTTTPTDRLTEIAIFFVVPEVLANVNILGLLVAGFAAVAVTYLSIVVTEPEGTVKIIMFGRALEAETTADGDEGKMVETMLEGPLETETMADDDEVKLVETMVGRGLEAENMMDGVVETLFERTVLEMEMEMLADISDVPLIENSPE